MNERMMTWTKTSAQIILYLMLLASEDHLLFDLKYPSWQVSCKWKLSIYSAQPTVAFFSVQIRQLYL